VKKLLLALFMIGCSTHTAETMDAGTVNVKNNAYVQHKMNLNYIKYYSACVRLCYKYSYRDDCSEKCKSDFSQINKLLIRCINENKEDDFDAVMDSWYGHLDF